METKFTKGKWEIMNAEKFGIPYIVYVGDETIFQCYNTNDGNVAEANALLISKAPEMFEMLEHFEIILRNGYVINKDHLSNIQQLLKEATEL